MAWPKPQCVGLARGTTRIRYSLLDGGLDAARSFQSVCKKKRRCTLSVNSKP